MEFADDIALGNFTQAELTAAVREAEHTERESGAANAISGLQFSLLISVLLHFTLALIVFAYFARDFERSEERIPRTLRVGFVPNNPLLTQAEDTLSQSPIESAAALPLDSTDPDPAPIDQLQAGGDTVENSEINEEALALAPPVELSTAEVPSRQESIGIPSVESVQSALNELRSRDASRFYSYDCNKIEEESEFNNCAPVESRNYSALTRNPVYDFHNPAIEISRSRETVTTLARQSGLVSQQLARSNLPAALSGYVLEELEQGIEIYSNNTVRALDHMNTMVDKSAAGLMASRMFDNWVQQQSVLLENRRVETHSDRRFRDRCRSYEKFIMAPTELARCLAISENPLGFSIKF